MRKSKKKELMNCIETLLKANGKVLKINSKGIVDFLTQCQEMAIMVGTEIDKIEGEDVITVSYLEQYCEEIYLMSVATDRGELIRAQKRGQALLHQVKDSICTDIPDSPAEVVFLPYKASMWDALDSVYRAAVADETCNVTVVPIPYYNINPKGEVLAVEYEGNLFPADIPVTDFRKIDLAKLHPDVIFIHNPYDEWNKVTQVPVEYFSSTLVNYTEHLVYIPYFVTKGDTIKDDYCYMPAVRNAWRTFVQSEAVRDCYIKNGADPKRIVTMGSPKFDMVLQMQENPPAIPQEWDTALGGHKIFLLNTHLNPIINEAEKTIDKLRQIFQLFRERDDVALLWRPHPLSIQTAKSMNPQILEQYMQLIEEFKTLPNGVYDDTPDVHRAIALSDAYIGHGSSLITMYGITGKPMYMLSVSGDANVRMPEEDRFLQFSCGALVENELWVPAEKYNALYKVNLDTFKANFVDKFEGEATRAHMFFDVISYQEKLFFVPKQAMEVIEYSIETGEQKAYPLEYGMMRGVTKFSETMVQENYLYMFPHASSNIVCLDMDMGEITNYAECCAELVNSPVAESSFAKGTKLDNIAWVGSRKTNCLVKFDLNTKQYEEFVLKDIEGGVYDVVWNGKVFYILNVNGQIYQWDENTQESELIWQYEKKDPKYSFSRIIYREGLLWVLPNRANAVIKMNLSAKQTQEINILQDEEIRQGYPGISAYLVKDDQLLCFAADGSQVLIIGMDKDTVEWKKVTYNEEREIYRQINYGKKHQKEDFYKYIYLEAEYPLEYFVQIIDDVDVIKGEHFFKSLQVNTDGSSGSKIWNVIEKTIS